MFLVRSQPAIRPASRNERPSCSSIQSGCTEGEQQSKLHRISTQVISREPIHILLSCVSVTFFAWQLTCEDVFIFD